MVSVLLDPRSRNAAALLAAGALLVAPGVASAKPKEPGHGATRGTTPCSILTPGVPPGVISTTGRYTIAASGNGTLVCHGNVAAPPPRTIVLKGLRCPTPAGVTWKSHTVIARSGRVHLTCHFKR